MSAVKTVIPKVQSALQWVDVSATTPFKFSTSAPVRQPEELKEHELLIKVDACGLNPVDYKMAENNFVHIKLPSVLGSDISGRVVAVHSSVADFKVGDEVFGCLTMIQRGGFQQYCVADDNSIVKKPASISSIQAASLGIAFLSAADGMSQVKDKIKPQTFVFVPGGSGGVGHFIVQIAKQWGAQVIATASKEEGLRLLKDECRADFVLNHAKEDVIAEVMKITNGKGADIVYDATYLPSSFEKSAKCVAKNGYWIVLGSGFGKPDSVEGKIVTQERQANVVAADLGKYSFPPVDKKRKEFFGTNLTQAAKWIEEGTLKPHINSVVSLEQVEETLKKMKEGKTGFGKIVAKISN